MRVPLTPTDPALLVRRNRISSVPSLPWNFEWEQAMVEYRPTPCHGWRIGFPLAAVVAVLASCGGGDSSPVGPRQINGSVRVTAVTEGIPIDPAGYTVALDDGPAQPLALNGSAGFSGVTPGSHGVTFGGWTRNCTPLGPSSRDIWVVAGEIAQETLEVVCSQSPPAGPGRELVFSTHRDGTADIYRMNDDGSGLIRVTSGSPPEHEPAWSPGGGFIALRLHIASSGTTGVNGEVHVMELAGSRATNVTNDPDAFDIQPAWAPDEARLAFTRLSLVDGSSEIFSVRVDGTDKRHITAGWQPHWSPDGTKIVFVDRGASGVGDLYIVSPDGTGRVALTTTPSVVEDEPAWSPDGSQVAYISNASGRFEIHVINADGSAAAQLTNNAGDGGVHDPTWSPDGRRIAFADAGDPPDIYVMDADGTNVVRLTFGGAQHPSWRPLLNR